MENENGRLKVSEYINGTETKEEKIAELMRNILELINPNIKEELLNKTPLRYAKALCDFTKGYDEDIESIISDAIFDSEDFNDIILIEDINFSSLCEHHILPFFGSVNIGYIPKKKILGLSKFPRIVNSLAKKLGLQERFTKEIAETIEKHLEPEGIVVVVNATHSCMCYRGVKSYHSKTKTIYTLGSMKDNDNLNRFFHLK